MKITNLKLLILINIIFLINTNKSDSQQFFQIARNIGINHFAFDPMIMAGGVCVLDYNNDGYEDLFMTSGLMRNHLYKNNGNGTFTEIPDSVNGTMTLRAKPSFGVTSGDINNDGFPDLFVATGARLVDRLFLNDGNGKFIDITESAGIIEKTYATAATMLDINNDGLIDIYVSVYGAAPGDPCFENVLYVNQGNNKFVNQAAEYNVADKGCALASVFSDVDNDGDKDLFIGNDFGYFYGKNRLLENKGPNIPFNDITELSNFDLEMNSMGIISGDYDLDGDFDYFVTNIDTNIFYRNDGNYNLNNIAKENGFYIGYVPQIDPTLKITATCWGGSFTDFNNDMFPDLAITAGHVISSEPMLDYDRLYMNNGDGTFKEVSEAENFYNSERNRGMAVLDFDNDGDMDICVATVHIAVSSPYRSKFYDNKLEKSINTNWLKIKLVGTKTIRDAYGSTVTVFSGGKAIKKELHGGGDTYFSKHSSILHFGLGNNTKVDSVKVNWLTKDTKVVKNINANQVLTIIQDVDAIANVSLCRGELFDGKLYDKSQSFYRKYTNSKGGDSVVAYNITINEPSSFTKVQNICEGDFYNDIQIYNDTTIVANLKNKVGCDSIFTLNLKVDFVPKNTQNIDLCYGKEYNGKPYFKSETITERRKNKDKCDSLITTNITVIESPKNEVFAILCYGGLFNERQYFKDTTIVKYFTTTFGCDSVSTIFLIVKPENITSENLSINFGELYNGILIENDTLITNKGTGFDGCDSTHKINISVITSVKDIEYFQSNNFNIYPNPNKGNFDLTINLDQSNISNLLSSSSKLEFRILNQNGGTIYNDFIVDVNSTNINHKIDLSNLNLTKGMYFVEILIDDASIKKLTKKFIIE
jgi:hypothetical protein